MYVPRVCDHEKSGDSKPVIRDSELALKTSADLSPLSIVKANSRPPQQFLYASLFTTGLRDSSEGFKALKLPVPRVEA